MNALASVAGIAVGGLLGYAGGRLAPRWTAKPPAPRTTVAAAVINALLTAFLGGGHGLGPYFWIQALFLAILTTASLVDLSDRIIPNELVLFGLGAGALCLLLPVPGRTVLGSMGGAAAGFGLLLFLALLVPGGMGLGDVKLAAVMGLFLGFPWVLMSLVLGFIAGGAAGLLLMLSGRARRKDTIPFGPYLALGAYVTSIYGNGLWTWYTSL